MKTNQVLTEGQEDTGSITRVVQAQTLQGHLVVTRVSQHRSLGETVGSMRPLVVV